MTASAPTKPYLEGKKLNKIEQNKANKDGLLDLEVLVELLVYLVSSPSLRSYVLTRYH